ncbi:MAG: mobile mystery protein A [Actinomycetota bacterium]
MKKSERARLARNRLTARFQIGTAAALADRPTHGWVRAIRDSLGMNARQLAARLNLSQAAVTQLERTEAQGTIRLDTLRRAADALNCDLMYTLIPRLPLGEMVMDRARLRARRDINSIDQTMRLESQEISHDEITRRIEDYAAKLITTGQLWDDTDRS